MCSCSYSPSLSLSLSLTMLALTLTHLSHPTHPTILSLTHSLTLTTHSHSLTSLTHTLSLIHHSPYKTHHHHSPQRLTHRSSLTTTTTVQDSSTQQPCDGWRHPSSASVNPQVRRHEADGLYSLAPTQSWYEHSCLIHRTCNQAVLVCALILLSQVARFQEVRACQRLGYSYSLEYESYEKAM